MSFDDRVTFRALPADLENLITVAHGLRAAGIPLANRTDALRHALSTVAASMRAAQATTP